jgi:hypothetical protein
MADEPFPGKPLGDGLYEISDEELKNWTIFRPGIPHHHEDESSTLPSERVTKDTQFALMDIIIFFDWVSLTPVDESGCNQWAFVVNDKEALYIRGKVHSITLSEAYKLDSVTVIHRFPVEVAKFIAPFLLKYRNNLMMFQICVNHLQCNNLAPFIYGGFFPPDTSYESDEEYEQAWQHLIGSLQPRDAIFTFDRRSLLSKAIAKFTHGPFSHCAVYAGEGIIHEIVTSGTRMISIDVYKGRHYRVAVYRHYGKPPDTVEEMLEGMRREDGRTGYSYFGALLAGIKAFRGKHVEAMAPNSLILAGPLAFITQA